MTIFLKLSFNPLAGYLGYIKFLKIWYCYSSEKVHLSERPALDRIVCAAFHSSRNIQTLVPNQFSYIQWNQTLCAVPKKWRFPFGVFLLRWQKKCWTTFFSISDQPEINWPIRLNESIQRLPSASKKTPRMENHQTQSFEVIYKSFFISLFYLIVYR